MEQFYANSPATLVLLIVTTIISLIAFLNPGLWRFLALEPYRMFHEKEFHSVVTSGFVHSGLGHLFINMCVLYMFGPTLESLLESPQFVIVYVVGLVVGSLYPLFKYRNRPEYVAIGASGAISGVVFAFCLFIPFAPLGLIFLPGIHFPAILFAILYVAYSVYAMKKAKDNIGHEAHLAGALGGVVATIIIQPLSVKVFIEQIQTLFT